MRHNAEVSFLDPFSTSPTKEDLCSDFPPEMLEKECEYGAPFFAYGLTNKSFGVAQGCCNHWDCQRCGIMRAKHEYGRIVEGIRAISRDSRISFITITCRGRDLRRDDAMRGYLVWTNKFLDACRAKAKRAGQAWIYVQVTEIQRRGHPHSHILTTFDPKDTEPGYVEKWETSKDGKKVVVQADALRSLWLQKQVIRSGLGEQYDISFVDSAEGASRYVAKYMFKETAFTADWPKGWKRVRYSQTFPRLEKRETNAFVLLSREDWANLAKLALIVKAADYQTWKVCGKMLRGHDVIVH
jgi:hypothetical protein